MDPHFNSYWPTPVAQGNGGLLKLKDPLSNSRWLTLVSQGNRELLEWRASNPNGSGPSTMWKTTTIQQLKQLSSKCDDHAKLPHINPGFPSGP